ncbi:MAG: methylmalonyl Co-A mutase-associated GTPase MeaB [Algoriphagus sp.]|uniref:methylmalonyl Co-A mutase-associated GTPase MeaB n=1 Tax=Algoriphagus sp. TaxID=1872435 RepID=UPI0027310397|nr:methylmalonyl Co-A mutase-associated GTPase MeaB [Algoriphagus sp.]MDP2042534.1 methylmalonyl Co-A mutase-associated GTPase MeaB [Algoriphagus sp.]MDP3472405.1 methylmalonyl Co-A mutase-associated GTPase MeaB [Algoriphagus sp.]
MKKRLELTDFHEGILSGNRVILSQAITLVESTLDSDQELASQLVQSLITHSGKSIRIGITGVPGVGKSTFIEAFGKMLLDLGKKVAVLAIDPSSQLTKGSILGDKTRMENLAADKRAFIRPSPSGTTLGGVSGKTREAMLLCEAAGFDVILVETVGVGQSETAVKNMVDFFLLLMLAGAGDELQGIKKGIMEMADALLIHKADGENIEPAKKAKVNYQNALHLLPNAEKNWNPKVLLASSTTGLGLEKAWELISQYKDAMTENGFWETNRATQRINWLDDQVQFLLGQAFHRDPVILKILEAEKPKVRSGALNPGTLAKSLIQIFLSKK